MSLKKLAILNHHEKEPNWSKVRAPEELETLISKVSHMEDVTSVEHIRTAHYAAFKAVRKNHKDGDLLVRIGASWTDQDYEFQTAKILHTHGAPVIVPLKHLYFNSDLDALTFPWLEHHPGPVTTDVWADTLTSIQKAEKQDWSRKFSNKDKSLKRLENFAKEEAHELAKEYKAGYHKLTKICSKWSWVHGDLHSDNIIRSKDGAIKIYDLDTACWAPAVWDITHLANRAGAGDNTGYDPEELRVKLNFTIEEYNAAMDLRKLAATIAQREREIKAV